MKVLALMPTPAVLAGLHFYHLKSKDMCLQCSGTSSPSGAPTLPDILGCGSGEAWNARWWWGGQVAGTEDRASHLLPGPEHHLEPVPH